MSKTIMVLSDGTGETAAQITKAALAQFPEQEPEIIRYKRVREETQLAGLLDEAFETKALIVYTIVSPQLRSTLFQQAMKRGLPCVDLLGPLLSGLGSYFGYEPKAVAGLLHDVNENYFKRIEAMEYTIAHDDGRDISRLQEADLVLIGISRTSKTPLSMYLSHQGWKVVNIPIIKDFELPQELNQIDSKKIIALTIDPETLTTIRRNRLNRLGQNQGGDYADPMKVNDEIAYADALFKKNRKWPVFNVTGKALEETAAEILRLMASRRLTPKI